MLFSLLFSLAPCNLIQFQCSQWNSMPSMWSTTQETVEISKGHNTIDRILESISIKWCLDNSKICNNYGYGHQTMQIPWDFTTSEFLGDFNQILNFDKFKLPLWGFHISYLKLIVKNCCDLFQKYVTSSTALMGNSQPRFKNRVETAVNFIRCEFHWSIWNSRHVYILAGKQIFISVRKE